MARVTGALVCVLMILFVAGCSSSGSGQPGHVTVTKTTNQSSDTTTHFPITLSSSTGESTQPAAETLTGNGGTFTYDVTPGTYAIAETVPTAWTQTANTCTSANLVVVEGQTVTCGITNSLTPSITPSAAALLPGQTIQFQATLPGMGVTWSVNGISGGNANVGTVDENGNYTAPSLALSIAVTVMASSGSLPTSSVSAQMYVVAPGIVTPTNNPQVANYTTDHRRTRTFRFSSVRTWHMA